MTVCDFMNFRADRAREISQALVSADFDGFTRENCQRCQNL